MDLIVGGEARRRHGVGDGDGDVWRRGGMGKRSGVRGGWMEGVSQRLKPGCCGGLYGMTEVMPLIQGLALF